jgi:hypothetical protein
MLKQLTFKEYCIRYYPKRKKCLRCPEVFAGSLKCVSCEIYNKLMLEYQNKQFDMRERMIKLEKETQTSFK